ncbi:MAG: protein translocase subunit SecD, partial [Gammaproteobacteria bacterium]|nr:protein translocase subunit SecD [Gammaproteobacteria bacterium]NNJ72145.1 protein translocase subunit SecD [Enterobacterales bacterium]
MLTNPMAVQRPINTYPVWKYILVMMVFLLGILYALPNLYGEDPSLQISPQRDAQLTSDIENTIVSVLDDSKIAYKALERDDKAIVVRFDDTDSQLSAHFAVDRAVRDAYGNDSFTVAMNLAPAAPDWLRNLGADPMKLGLDLRGGIYFLMEVDMNTAIDKREDTFVSEFKDELREQKLRYIRPITRDPKGGIEVRFREEEDRDKAYDFLRGRYQELTFETEDGSDSYDFRAYFNQAQLKSVRDEAVRQNITTLRNRVNQLGVAEPVIQRQGAERI